jgi:hypothetical protein
MFRDPFRTTPLVADISDINLKVRVQRADAALYSYTDLRLPNLQIR